MSTCINTDLIRAWDFCRLVICFTLVGAGCRGTEAASPETRDATTGGEAWSTATLFVARAGTFDGEPIVFDRVFHGAFDGDGNVVVIGSDRRLIYLDASGRVSGAFGRRGNGPGEFEVIDNLVGSTEGIVVMDRVNHRVTAVRGRDIAWERSVQLPPMQRFVGVFQDRTPISTIWTLLDGPRRPSSVPPGTIRAYYIWNESGSSHAAIAGGVEPAPGFVRWEYDLDGRTTTHTVHLDETCLPAWRAGVAGDRMFLADSEQGVLLSMERSGRQRVLYQHPRDTVTATLLQNLRSELEILEPFRPAPTQAESAFFERVGNVGDPLPSYWSAMLVDPWGTQGIWLRRATCFDGKAPELWEVFDTNGALQGTVELPPHTRLLAVQGRQMLAVATDALGVEAITVLAIVDHK